jgi:AhpD family alkylhydroperoxidase
MALENKEKELVAVGISVVAGCKPCTNYHVREVRKAGANDEEIRQAIADATCVRNSAGEIMKAHGLRQAGEQAEEADSRCGDETSRIKELVSVGAAFAVNCTANLQEHLDAAKTVGVTEEEVNGVIELAERIKEVAASHAKKALGMAFGGGG